MSYYEDDPNPPAPPVLKPVSGSAKDAEAALVTQNDEPAELQTMHEQEIPDILMFSPAAMAKRAESNETQPSSGLSEGEGKFSNIRLQVVYII